MIAHGMFTMALVGRAVTGWAGAPDAVVEYGVRFTRPVRGAGRRRGHRDRGDRGGQARSTEDGLTRLDLTATCGGEKVLVAGAGDRPDDALTARHAWRETGWESRAGTRTLVRRGASDPCSVRLWPACRASVRRTGV